MSAVTDPPKHWLRFCPRLVLIAFPALIVLGLIGTWLPAFGYLPAIGHNRLEIAPWEALWRHPGLPAALNATLVSGLGAAAFSLALALALCALCYRNRFWILLERALAPILAVPHAAFAIGFGFLIAPSGWILRLLSPTLSGFSHPPDWILPKDPLGLSLMAAMVLKETPFLILVILAALNQLRVSETLAVGRSLGYSPVMIWVKVIIPQLYPRIRLSLFAVLAYSLSVVDLAMILGPTTPPTLGVLVLRWFNDPDLSLRLTGSAGATLLLGLTGAAIGVAIVAERALGFLLREWSTAGGRHLWLNRIRGFGNGAILVLVVTTLLSVLALVLWSLTWRWPFPSSLPVVWSLKFWLRGLGQAGEPILVAALIGTAAALAALVLAVGCLEYEVVRRYAGKATVSERLLWLLYLPLLVPQIAFMFGIQTVLSGLRLDGRLSSLIFVHLLFVLPYLFLTLAATYRSFDERMFQTATALSGSTTRAFLKIKLPMLTRPLLFAFAIGFSVSIAQYIPTLFVGAGRFSTITTEAVNLAGGADRRIVAVYALCQQFLPLLLFLAAIFIPKVIFARRRGMQV